MFFYTAKKAFFRGINYQKRFKNIELILTCRNEQYNMEYVSWQRKKCLLCQIYTRESLTEGQFGDDAVFDFDEVADSVLVGGGHTEFVLFVLHETLDVGLHVLRGGGK